MRPEPRKILLVVDEPTLGAVTAFRLELMGYDVQSVATADEAFDALANQTPGLIVVDLLLGGSEGLRIVDRLSNDARSSGIPVLALSSNADLEDVQRAYAAGAEDYLVVPYDPNVLEEKLDRWLPIVD
jgi:CheY-like chemotaxis protein